MMAPPSAGYNPMAMPRPGEPLPVGPSTQPSMGGPGASQFPPAEGAAPPAGAEGATPPTGAEGATPPTGAEGATPPGATAATPPAPSSGLGGGLSEPQGALNMFGDVAPVSRLAILQSTRPGFVPPPPPEPPNRPTRFPSERMKSAAFVPSVRNFKIADNQTPMPVDRITYSFNFFDDVNGAINKRFNVPLSDIQAYRHVFGFEKTFFDKNASFGMRLPLNTLTANSSIRNLGSTSTSLGDLTAFVKYALWIDREQGRVISTGLAITMPTGPATFGGANYLRGLHYTNLQPFIAGQWTWGNLYAINFTSVDVPTSSRDVTLLYQDFSLGYFLYRNPNPNGFIRSIAPTIESHVNVAFNHNNPFDRRDIMATSQVVGLTEGLNVFFKNNSVLSFGVVEPVTGPRPFNIEAMLLFNTFF
ncbi:hypothetical protein [Singulisphaera sp. GP187]|uniref:hypothetical protein n=1 Tax=Singulisphaera sp. GP187 TaxID=1882752 RepID=UPI0020B16940|nr:hypothetical protein [Singulisphaera sp. GP187]